MFKLDFTNTYLPELVSPDLSQAVFISEDKKGQPVRIKSIISPHPLEVLKDVYNFGFGVENEDGTIDDKIIVRHKDPAKLMSSVMFHAFTYLRNNKNQILGIDGSNDVRARLYHRMIKSNQDYLTAFFKIQGVDWYVRLLRNGEVELDPSGNPFFKPRPEEFDFNRESFDLYRYYTFYLSDN